MHSHSIMMFNQKSFYWWQTRSYLAVYQALISWIFIFYVSPNDFTILITWSHLSSLNLWISTLVDEIICTIFKMSWDLEDKPWQITWVISLIPFKICKMKINSNNVNASYAKFASLVGRSSSMYVIKQNYTCYTEHFY